jgi:Arc/MetJ family transcription regulator
MKRTNIVLNEKLVETGKELTGLKTSRAVVEYALSELVRRRKQARILSLRGSVGWRGNLRSMRSLRTGRDPR